MPDTRPGIIFKDGVCLACVNHEKQSNVDWKSRYRELEVLCDKYRRKDGYYDCMIPVSGGKDSYTQTYVMKELLDMHPLLFCVADPFTHTEAGTHNLKNLSEMFNCDYVVYTMSVDLFRRVTKIGFETLREPLRFIESALYTTPFKYAVSLNIPLVVFGENAAYTYGTTDKDSYNARRYVDVGHSASGVGIGNKITDYWVEQGIPLKDMNCVILPKKEELDRNNPEVIFMGYFMRWDDEYNMNIAKRYGFRDLHHEWKREGCVEDYAQIDSIGFMLHLWTKFPKFGFSRTSDIVSRWVRKDMITREKAMDLVNKYDHKLDQKTMEDFCQFMGYNARQFWDIIEGYWNKEIFEKVNGLWRMKV
jgi:N-acetyl sugar amidotransferase